MTGFPCRVLPFALADGPGNMAIDEWMLRSVAADPSTGYLRTYGWSEPTLSLGYFQDFAAVKADPRWRNVPIVRRSTGGGAIWHHHDLTYAIALPTHHPLARRVADLYQAVHECLIGLLVTRGFQATRRGGDGAERSPQRPLLCFLDRDPNDVVIGQAKLIGSAQRRRAGSLLQQGSLLLAASRKTPELPGLAELNAAPGPSAEDLSFEFETRLLEFLALNPHLHAAPDASELASLDAFYRNPQWTRRRSTDIQS